MLSEREQRMLRAVEAQLASEDSEFARVFAVRQRRMGTRKQLLSDKTAYIALTISGFIVLIAGSFAAALQFLPAAGLAWFMWHSAPPNDESHPHPT